MRDELTLMELVDRYLGGELNASDRAAFEERIRTNAELRELVEDQRVLLGGMQRIALRPAVNKAYRSYKWGKWLPGVGGAMIMALLLTVGYFASERSEIQDPFDQEQITPEATMDAPDEGPDTIAEPAWEGSPRPLEVRSHTQQTDTVVMIMRDGHLVPMTAQDTIGKRVYRRVITVPVEGASPEELKGRMDSIKKSGATYNRPGLEKISADSLQKLFGGDKAPLME
jgi:hypothetical protein